MNHLWSKGLGDRRGETIKRHAHSLQDTRNGMPKTREFAFVCVFGFSAAVMPTTSPIAPTRIDAI